MSCIPQLLVPADGAVLPLQTSAQKAMLASRRRFVPHKPNITPRKRDLTTPLGVVFRWKGGAGELQLCQDAAFEQPLRYRGNGCCTVCNLLPGSLWYWRVMFNNGQRSEIRFFTIEDALPVFLHLEGLSNVRDLGGWRTNDGRLIRSRMLIRGCQFEPKGTLDFRFTEAGKATYFGELGVRTELDLRGLEEGRETLVHPGYRRIHIPSSAYATWAQEGIFSAEQKETMKRIFTLLCDENVYPLYFHCAGGGDRTGTLAFLIETLLGVSLEDALTDYEYSNLSISGERSRFSQVFTAFLAKLETYAPGKGIQCQVRAYLRDCGVSSVAMHKLRSLLLE
ncbi:MAG: tyrosine-protein phosphatase [Victivallales bacterium]|nr:tyrosine-protein phosphatase [Victivallales bacterium]